MTTPTYQSQLPRTDSGIETSLTSRILANRGITDARETEIFLNPNYESGLHDPFLLNDMEKAVGRILEVIRGGGRIAIFSDYDCDGIPGGVILHDFFKKIGYKNFRNYIPHRHFEGYGFSKDAVDILKEDGAEIIITIDCGTTNVEAVAHANTLGIEVIVTDHHEPLSELPATFALINPKIGETYPFDGICGSGVVYKLVQGLIARGDFGLVVGWEKWLLDLVGIATIADMVPLVDENRVLARYGLEVLRKSRRPGLLHLLRKARIEQSTLTEEDVGFTIAPRINAASRMDTPEDAFTMLATTDEAEAGACVAHLEKLNNERRGVVAGMTKEAKKKLEGVTQIPDVLVLGSPEWKPSLVGLTANSLSEEFKRPVFLWGKDGNGVIKGSCRSEGKTSVVKLMEGTPDIFMEYGGHHMSGGFSVHDDHIHTLSQALNTSYSSLGSALFHEEDVMIDATLALSEIDHRFLKELGTLGPFGIGNPKPIFKFESIVPEAVTQFGKGSEHLKLVFNENGRRLEALAFFATESSYTATPRLDVPLTLLAHVEESFFMNRRQTRLRIVDILA